MELGILMLAVSIIFLALSMLIMLKNLSHQNDKNRLLAREIELLKKHLKQNDNVTLELFEKVEQLELQAGSK